MHEAAFAPEQRRSVVRAEGGYQAFLPPPLPPVVAVDRELVTTLSTADRAIGELAGMGRTVLNPEILAAPIVLREAVLSSRVAGIQASYDQLALFDIDRPVAGDADVREVHNYVAALARVLDPDRRVPLGLPLLLEAHDTLLTGVRGGHATPGELRRGPDWIGPAGCTLEDADYVAPPPERLRECLDAFERHLRADHTLPPLVTIGQLHYQLEAIHPFAGGNGRLGRLLVALLLIEWGLLPAPLLDISAWIEPRRDEYFHRLLRVSTHGDWSGWLRYFLSAVAEQAADALLRARGLHELRKRYRVRATTLRGSRLLPQLVDSLFVAPATTVGRACEVLKVSHRLAWQDMERLVAAGIVTEVAPAGRTRRFVATEIIEVVNGQR